MKDISKNGEIWWGKMHRGTSMMSHIETIVLCDAENLVLETGDDLPWGQEMRTILQSHLRERFPSGGIDFLEDSDQEPGEILLNRYCKQEVRRNYRPTKGYPSFLAEVEGSPLSMRIVWLRKLNGKRLEMWYSFVKEYYKALKGKEGAIFILEAESVGALSPAKGIHLLSRNQIIRPFESKLFYLMLAADIDACDRVKEYLMELAWDICRENIELGAICLGQDYWQDFIENPQMVMEKISGNETYSDDTIIEYHLSDMDAERGLWNSQIKHVFPRIEKYRREFVDRHKGKLSELQIYNSRNQYVEEVEETEIGTLYYYAANRQLPVGDGELNKLKSYYEARNKLAHNEALEWSMVQQILS